MKHGGGEERSASEESGVSTASQIRVRVRTQEPLPFAQFLLPVARDDTLAQLRARIHSVLLQHYAGDAQWDPAALALEVDGFRLWEDQVATLLRDGETLTVLCLDEGPPRKRTRQQEPDDVMLEANRIVQNMRAEVGPRGERKMSLRMQGEPSFPMPPPGMPGLAGGVAEALSAFESRKRQRQNGTEGGAEKNNADGTERVAHSDSEVIQGVQVSADPATGDNAKAKASYTVTTGGAASDTSSSETESTESSDSDASSSSDESSSDTSTESDSTESDSTASDITESDSTASDDSESDQDTRATSSSDGEHNVQQSSTEETTGSAPDTSTASSDNTSESSQSDEESSDGDASSDTDAESDSNSSSASTASSAPSTAPTTAKPTSWVPPGQGKASTKRKNLRRRERQRQQAAEAGTPVANAAEASAQILRPAGALPPGGGTLDILSSAGGAVPDAEAKPVAPTPLENIAQRMLAHTTVGYRRRRSRQAAAPVSSMPLAEPGPTQHASHAVGQALQRQFTRTPPPSMRPPEEIPKGVTISSTDCAAWYEQQWQDEWDAENYAADDPATRMYLEMQRQVRSALAEEKRAEELAEAAAAQDQNSVDEDASEAKLRAALPREFGSTRVKRSLQDAADPGTGMEAPPMHAMELPMAEEEQMDLDYGAPEPARHKSDPAALAEAPSGEESPTLSEAPPERPRRSMFGAIRDALFHWH